MKSSPQSQTQKPKFIIRVRLIGGETESFAPANETEAQRIWEQIEPARLFASGRLILAGDHSKSVFVSEHILRVDFIQDRYACWEFPGGYSDIVELSEKEFRKNAHLDQPKKMAKRQQPTPAGDLLVSFLKFNMMDGSSLYLMAEFAVGLPIENQSFMKFLLGKGGVHFRLRGGGFGVLNLANLVSYTVYPGVAELPSDAWLVEPFKF